MPPVNPDEVMKNFSRIKFPTRRAPKKSLVSIDQEAAEDMAKENIAEAVDLLVEIIEQLHTVEQAQFLQLSTAAKERRQLIEQAHRLTKVIRANQP